MYSDLALAGAYGSVSGVPLLLPGTTSAPTTNAAAMEPPPCASGCVYSAMCMTGNGLWARLFTGVSPSPSMGYAAGLLGPPIFAMAKGRGHHGHRVPPANRPRSRGGAAAMLPGGVHRRNGGSGNGRVRIGDLDDDMIHYILSVAASLPDGIKHRREIISQADARMLLKRMRKEPMSLAQAEEFLRDPKNMRALVDRCYGVHHFESVMSPVVRGCLDETRVELHSSDEVITDGLDVDALRPPRSSIWSGLMADIHAIKVCSQRKVEEITDLIRMLAELSREISRLDRFLSDMVFNEEQARALVAEFGRLLAELKGFLAVALQACAGGGETIIADRP